MPPVTRTSSSQSSPLLGDVLVTGGCGFFGYHLVRQLLADPECGAVTVLDRNTSHNRLNDHPDGRVTYVTGSITDASGVNALVKRVRPRVIFHAASPNFTFPTKGLSRNQDFRETNIRGTEILLQAARDNDATVRAFVFTSTVDVYAFPPHTDVAETHPLGDVDPGADGYTLTKAIANRLVEAANQAGGSSLKTVSLMLSHMYGVRDSQGMKATLDALGATPGNRRRMWPMVQIGSGRNEVELVSVENAALAHRLAAKALLDPSRAGGRVDGEAFNISDGEGGRRLWWHHVGMIWKAAAVYRGELVDESAPTKKIVIPAWVILFLAWIVQWLFVEPPLMFARTAVDYMVNTHTYSSRKARERLRFEPEADHDATIMEAVKWELQRRDEEFGKSKKSD